MLDDDAPGLGIDFTINPEFSGLTQLMELTQTAEFQMLKQAKSIEQATSGMVDLSGATMQFTAFGSAADRSFKLVENQGERLVAQLDRLNQNFGLNSDQIRANKVETAALAAEQKGMTELADRLRTGLAQYSAQQAAAAAEAQAQAQALRDAAQAHAMFQARVREGAAALKQAEAATAADAQAARELRAALDPVAAATAAAAVQLDKYRAMQARGVITAEELAGAERMLANGANGLGHAHSSASASTMILQHSVRSTADSMAAGLPITMIIGEQIGRLGEAAALSGGSMGKFGAVMAGPWGLAISAGISLAAILAGHLWGAQDASEGAARGAHTHKEAVDALTKAINDDNAALSKQVTASHSTLAASYNAAVGLRDQEIAQRNLTKAKLADALAEQARNANTPNAVTNGMGYGQLQGMNAAAVANLKEMLAGQDQALEKAQNSVHLAELQVSLRRVKEATDANAKADGDYERAEARLEAAFLHHKISQKELEAQSRALTQAYQAGKKALDDHHGSAMTAANDDAAITAAGTGTARALAELAKARDVDRAAVRAGTMSQAQATADIAKHIEAVNAAKAAHAGHAAGLREDAKALRENMAAEAALDASLRSIQSQFDPVAAAASHYSDQVDQINKLASAGAITADQQRNYLLAAALAFGEVGRKADDAAVSLKEWGVTLDTKKEVDQIGNLIGHMDLLKGSTLNIGEAFRTIGDDLGEFVKKGSAGYKLLTAGQKAYHTLEMAMALKTAAVQIGLIGAHTAAAVTGNALIAASDTARAGTEQANSVATAAVKGVEAVVNAIKSLPFPANIAAGAATLAAITALGVGITGGFGGHGNNLPKANDGTGTVLGDATGASASIKNSIDALKDVDTNMLTASHDMLAALRSIDSQIGSLTTTLINAGNIGSAVGVSNVNGGLFGTSKKIVGSGVYGGSQNLGDILASGSYSTDYYADVQKKKKLFGITTSTSYKTQYASDGSDVDNQFALILKGFDQDILAAAGPLGTATDAVAAKLNSFVVNIGKIDLTGLTGEQIQDKLQAVFSAAGDQLAAAAIPGLQQYQKAGEGYLQTLTRVASTVETVTATLDKLGTSAAGLGIDAEMGVAAQFDSLSDFTSAAGDYFDAYYSDAERAAAQAAQLGKVFDSMGLAMPATLDGFRDLVSAQDLLTSSGQAAYATLLQIAPAFAELEGSLTGAKSAADRLSEQQDLQSKLWDLLGDTADIRAAELAKLDPSNRALQEQIYAVQDAQDAAKAASDLASAWQSVGDSIQTEIARIRGLGDTTGTASFAQLMGQFNAATAAARAGGQDAAKSLPALSQSLLTAAAQAATSRQELDRVQAQTAASLQTTYDTIEALSGQASGAASDAGAVGAAAAASSGAATGSTTEDTASELAAIRSELVQLRTDTLAASTAIANNTGRIDKRLADVTNDSQGRAVTVAAAAAA